MKIWSSLCLALALLAFAAALCALVQAPTLAIFRLAVGVTEFGHWLFLVPVLLACIVPRDGWRTAMTRLFASAAAGLCLLSAVRGQLFASTLPGLMAPAFPRQEERATQPFSWRKLWVSPALEPVPVETLSFSEHDGAKLFLRFYRSHTRTSAPCVLVIHGGGWENGSPDEFVAFNHHLARAGYAVAALQYRFAPRWPWPAQRDDVLEALRFLESRAQTLGIDPTQFVLLGRSAGGQIAESVAYGAHDSAIRGCIAFYAPADMHFSYEFARDDDILSSPKVVRQFMGGTPEEARASYDSASPILLASASSPPTLLLHGQRDELVWYLQSHRLARRLQELGVPHCFVHLPWATHAFDFNLYGPGGQISTYAVDRFLRNVTR